MSHVSPPHWSQPSFSGASVRYGHCSVLIKSLCYVVGGRDANDTLITDTCVQNLRGVSWSTLEVKGFAPSPREHLAAAATRTTNLLYVFGGQDDTGLLLNDMFSFNPTDNVWTEVPAGGEVPPPVAGHTLTWLQGKFIAFGGFQQVDGGGRVTNYDSSFCYSFDVTTLEWTELNFPADHSTPPARSFHSAVATEEGQLLVFGGQGAWCCLNDLWVLQAGVWTQPVVTGALPSRRRNHSSVIIDGRMFIFGGCNSLGTYYNDMYMLDLETYDWQAVVTTGRVPKPRAFQSMVAYYDLMIVHGGVSGPAVPPKDCPAEASFISAEVHAGNPSGLAHKTTFLLDTRKFKKQRNLITNSTTVKEQFALNEFELKATIGTGSFGRVRLVYHRKTRRYMAMKILIKKRVLRLKQVDHILNEKKILEQVQFPFIVNMYGSFQDQSSLYIMMQYIVGGEFFSHLRKARRFGDKTAKFYTSQIVLVFEYLHKLNVVYRDLKPENLLIAKNGYLRVTDFGFAKTVQYRTWTLCGTPEYIAPEVLLSTGHGKPVDWWALGVLIYEMLVGKPPFVDDNPMGIYRKILSGKVKFPRYFSPEIKDLLGQLLQSDISLRIGNLANGAQDVKDHAWFKGFDWQAVISQTMPAPWTPTVLSDHDTKHFEKYASETKRASPLFLNPDPFKDF